MLVYNNNILYMAKMCVLSPFLVLILHLASPVRSYLSLFTVLLSFLGPWPVRTNCIFMSHISLVVYCLLETWCVARALHTANF